MVFTFLSFSFFHSLSVKIMCMLRPLSFPPPTSGLTAFLPLLFYSLGFYCSDILFVFLCLACHDIVCYRSCFISFYCHFLCFLLFLISAFSLHSFLCFYSYYLSFHSTLCFLSLCLFFFYFTVYQFYVPIVV